jgi:hypothetical protein
VLTLFLALDRSADSQFLIIQIDLRSLLLIYCTSSSPANPASETGVEMEKRELRPAGCPAPSTPPPPSEDAQEVALLTEGDGSPRELELDRGGGIEESNGYWRRRSCDFFSQPL